MFQKWLPSPLTAVVSGAVHVRLCTRLEEAVSKQGSELLYPNYILWTTCWLWCRGADAMLVVGIFKLKSRAATNVVQLSMPLAFL